MSGITTEAVITGMTDAQAIGNRAARNLVGKSVSMIENAMILKFAVTVSKGNASPIPAFSTVSNADPVPEVFFSVSARHICLQQKRPAELAATCQGSTEPYSLGRE